MALTGWSTANNLTRASVVTSARPVLVSAWVHRGNDTSGVVQRIATIGTDGILNHRRSLQLASNGSVQVEERDTSGSNANSAAPPANAWGHAAAAWVHETLREVWRDAANKNTQATARNPTGMNGTYIGIGPDGTLPWPAAGALAEISFWDLDGFSEADRDALVALLGTPVEGEAPNPIDVNAQAGQPWTGKLLSYWRLLTASDLSDLSGNGHDMTMNGTLTEFASHPPVEEAPAGGGPGAPSLTAQATSWDATRLEATAGDDTDEIDIRRSTTSPVTESDALAATLTPDGVAFDAGAHLDPATEYFYRPFARNAEGTTPGPEASATTFADDAVETMLSGGDPLVIPYEADPGETIAGFDAMVGKIVRAVAGVDRQVDIHIEVQDGDEQVLETFNLLDVGNVDGGEERADLMLPEPVESCTVHITATIAPEA